MWVSVFSKSTMKCRRLLSAQNRYKIKNLTLSINKFSRYRTNNNNRGQRTDPMPPGNRAHTRDSTSARKPSSSFWTLGVDSLQGPPAPNTSLPLRTLHLPTSVPVVVQTHECQTNPWVSQYFFFSISNAAEFWPRLNSTYFISFLQLRYFKDLQDLLQH